MEALIKEKVQNVTSKGQITLPVAWRRKTGAGQIVVRVKGDVLQIAPARLPARAAPKEYIVFDALRDNKGKGIKASDILTLLRKLDDLEDMILASDRKFVQNMRHLRREHIRGHVGTWQALKEKYGV